MDDRYGLPPFEHSIPYHTVPISISISMTMRHIPVQYQEIECINPPNINTS